MRSIKERTRGKAAERSIEKYKERQCSQHCHNDKITKKDKIKDKMKKYVAVKSIGAFITPRLDKDIVTLPYTEVRMSMRSPFPL